MGWSSIVLLIVHAAVGAWCLPALLRKKQRADTIAFAALLAYSAYCTAAIQWNLPDLSVIKWIDFTLTPPGKLLEQWTGGPPP